MKHKSFYTFGALVLIFSMLLAACATGGGEEVAPTEVPAEPTVAVAAFEPIKLSTADCSYGGNVLAIESLDELTVKVTLCNPDPAFLVKIAVPAFAIYGC